MVGSPWEEVGGTRDIEAVKLVIVARESIWRFTYRCVCLCRRLRVFGCRYESRRVVADLSSCVAVWTELRPSGFPPP